MEQHQKYWYHVRDTAFLVSRVSVLHRLDSLSLRRVPEEPRRGLSGMTLVNGAERDRPKFKPKRIGMARESQAFSRPSWKRITIRSARRRTPCFARRLDT